MSCKLTETKTDARSCAISLWRSGKLAEARSLLEAALSEEANAEEGIALSITLSLVERADGKPEVALKVLLGIAQDVERYYLPVIKGKYFNALGAAYYALGDIDKAFEAYTAASIWYERAKEWKLRSEVENNIGLLMLAAGRFEAAHEHLNLATEQLGDEVVNAQIEDTRARIFLAEGYIRPALDSALASVLALKETAETRLLFESLETLRAVTEEMKREHECDQISVALLSASGKVKSAAKLLGVSHQTLAWKLEHHHPQLLALRAPKKKPRGLHASKA